MERRNKLPIQTFPACSLCEGRGFINYQNVIKFDCPACRFETWDNAESVQLIVTEHNAKRIRAGYPEQHQTPKIYWKRTQDEWKTKSLTKKPLMN